VSWSAYSTLHLRCAGQSDEIGAAVAYIRPTAALLPANRFFRSRKMNRPVMGRKPAPKPDDPAQSQRFLDTAKEVGADTDDEALERAFKKIAPRPPSNREAK
jgi:hypothetical protein